MTRSLFDYFKEQDVEIYRSLDISAISSIGIGTVCDYAVYPHNEEEFLSVISFLEDNSVKYFVIGRMTNVLPCTESYRGVIVFTSKMQGYSAAENVVSAECGMAFSLLLKRAATDSLGGYEELFGIPGSIGGMVYNNAGAFGKSVSDCFLRARLFSLDDVKLISITSSDMQFSYRKSLLQNKRFLLLSAEFAFVRKDKTDISEAMRKTVSKRKNSQPTMDKSLGSIFKRHEGVPVSKAIDELGLKGFRIGGAEISKKHAGFIINVGGATSDDVLRLIEIIKVKILKEYGFVAEEEIELLI